MLTYSHEVKYTCCMNSLSTLFIKIGRSRIRKSLGIGVSALSNAEKRGTAPSKWYDAIDELGKADKVNVPRELFNFTRTSNTKAEAV